MCLGGRGFAGVSSDDFGFDIHFASADITPYTISFSEPRRTRRIGST
jgi:hypothetical protein